MLFKSMMFLAFVTVMSSCIATLTYAQSVSSAPKVNTFSYTCEVLANSYICTLHIPNAPSVKNIHMSKLGRRLVGFEGKGCATTKHIIDLLSMEHTVVTKTTCKDRGI